MATAAPATVRPRAPRAGWALPPRPPEEWVAPGWSVVLTLLLGAGVVVPLTAVLRADPRTAQTAGSALLAVVLAVSAAVLAHALLVQATVTGDRRLAWVGAGPLLLHPLALWLVPSGPAVERPDAALLLLAVVPVLALTAPLVARLPLPGLALVALALLAAAAALAGTVPALDDDALRLALVAALVVSLAAVAVWHRCCGGRSPWSWVTLGLALTALAVLSGLLDLSGAWTGVLAALPLAVPAAGLGLVTELGYSRQARQWHALEQEVRDSRIPTALLPGRSVSPEDEEGLPEPDEVQAVLDSRAVVIALQPVLRLADGAVVGQEALARFGGRIPTDRWFRGAARAGLGLDLEALCLERALLLLDELPPEQFLAVNVSPAAIAEQRTLEAFERVDLTRVVVEVTEHEAVADYPGVRRTLDRLRARGARTAVDDTGAGYASLRHVLLLQPEVVKLDTALVRDLRSDPRKRALVVALTRFAQEVGSTVLGEGIETGEQLQELLEIGVDLGQGWHLGVPVLPGEAGRPARG